MEIHDIDHHYDMQTQAFTDKGFRMYGVLTLGFEVQF